MTHGHEKSDSAIVAVKPTNKVERSAAEQSAAEPTATEPVERRAETKGNAGQQSTRRAQSRASVSQALERIRRVARERKKEKFTSLLHHISIAAAGCRPEGHAVRAPELAHHAASAVRRLPGPSDPHHASCPGDPESQEASQRDLREAHRPAAQEDRGRARARLLPDWRNGNGLWHCRQGDQ